MFEVKATQEGDDYILPIPEPIMRAMDLQDGTELNVTLDGSTLVLTRTDREDLPHP